jgi:DNA-binding transcriptional LysR family regulator
MRLTTSPRTPPPAPANPVACNTAGFDPQITQEASRVPIATALVAAGLGIALVPQCAKNMHTPGVVYRTLDATPASTEIALIHRRQDRSKVIQNFVQMCLKRAKMRSLN